MLSSGLEMNNQDLPADSENGNTKKHIDSALLQTVAKNITCSAAVPTLPVFDPALLANLTKNYSPANQSEIIEEEVEESSGIVNPRKEYDPENPTAAQSPPPAAARPSRFSSSHMKTLAISTLPSSAPAPQSLAQSNFLSRYPTASRMFIGNLNVDKTSKSELTSIFSKYGKVLEVSLKNSYGFVQFDNANSCSVAMQAEQKRELHGLYLGKISLF